MVPHKIFRSIIKKGLFEHKLQMCELEWTEFLVVSCSYSSIERTFACACSFTMTTSDCIYSFVVTSSCEPTTSFATPILTKPTKNRGKKKQDKNKRHQKKN